MREAEGSKHGGVPTKVGPYRIVASVAAGGMGTVYLAKSPQPDGSELQIALKVLHAQHAQDDDVARRFVDEGRVGARIAHPNVVAVLDAGQIDGTSYLALEYVHGDTLSSLLRASVGLEKPLPLPIVSSILLDLLAGLHAAHEVMDENGEPLGIVHRDVSPQNILVDLEGRAFISDFGVAKVKDSLRTTRSGTMIGKAGYMAPEQLVGAIVNARTDLYASGILLWECLAGKRLFSGVEDQIQAVVSRRTQPRVKTERADVPDDVDQLIAEVLEHAPEDRPQSAFEISSRLSRSIPRASRSEVGAWVKELVGAKLAERQRIADMLDEEEEETVARPFSSMFTEAGSPITPSRVQNTRSSVLPPPNPPPRSTSPRLAAMPHREDPSTTIDTSQPASEGAIPVAPATDAPPSVLRVKTPTMISVDAVRTQLPTVVARDPSAPRSSRALVGWVVGGVALLAMGAAAWFGVRSMLGSTADAAAPTASLVPDSAPPSDSVAPVAPLVAASSSARPQRPIAPAASGKPRPAPRLPRRR